MSTTEEREAQLVKWRAALLENGVSQDTIATLERHGASIVPEWKKNIKYTCYMLLIMAAICLICAAIGPAIFGPPA
jgi:hypothetical protein